MSVSWLLKDKVSYTIHTGIHSLKYLFGYVVYGLMFYIYFVLMSTFKTNRNELCVRCKQHNYTLCSYMTFQYKQKVNKKGHNIHLQLQTKRNKYCGLSLALRKEIVILAISSKRIYMLILLSMVGSSLIDPRNSVDNCFSDWLHTLQLTNEIC